MSQPLEPIRMLSVLRSHGVIFVLSGGAAMAARGGPIDIEVVEVCIPQDPENIPRLGLALEHLGATPIGEDADDRSSYKTTAGLLDVVELREGFEDLAGRSSDVDLGNGLVAKVASTADLTGMARDAGDLAGAVTLAALDAEDAPLPIEHEDEFGPTREARSGPRWVDRMWKRFEDVDDFLTRTIYNNEHHIRS
ncbi:MAG: hypothetical protein ABJB55_09065 [Actinomycetota bacterium]